LQRQEDASQVFCQVGQPEFFKLKQYQLRQYMPTLVEALEANLLGALDDPLNQTVYDPACPNGPPKENIDKQVIYMDAFPKSSLAIKQADYELVANMDAADFWLGLTILYYCCIKIGNNLRGRENLKAIKLAIKVAKFLRSPLDCLAKLQARERFAAELEDCASAFGQN
jgi:hypothetical protein